MLLPGRNFANESMCAMKNKQRYHESDLPVKLTFQSLKEVTNNFADKLGSGASSEVYRGEFDGKVIAVKKLPFRIGIDEKLFQNEYEHLKRLKHHNIVRLVGFCDETEHVFAEYKGKTIIAEEIHRALCLEFLPNGPLSDYLREKYTGHSWYTRFQIINGMCEGLKYIHEVSVVHLDIKPGNILLDAKMIPKIADFGLSRLLVEECIREATQLGTIGYIPREFIDNQVISREFDIFSLGVTIMKILTEPMDYWNISYMNDKECIEHDNWRKRFEEIPRYPWLEDCKQVRTCIEIALRCMDPERLNRPSLNHIVSKLIPVRRTVVPYTCDVERISVNYMPAPFFEKEELSPQHLNYMPAPFFEEEELSPQHLNYIPACFTSDSGFEVECMSANSTTDLWLPIDIQEIDTPQMPSPEPEDSHIRTCELSFEFLREITNDFSKDRIVSECASATIFKGILNSGEETRVKRFRASKKDIPDKEFQNEVGKLMEIKHKNIVRLLGYCNEKKREAVKHDGRYIVTCKVETLLLYEYVPNRSLDQYIYGDSCQLEWNMRFKIILAICEALHFLHTELNKPISHLPLTPENILLDKKLVPKLSDIGLSDLFEGLSPEGTEYDPEINRYKAPEYINRYTISFQSNIYSLGLLIMDIATGEKDSSHARQTMDSSHSANVRQKWTDEYIASKYTSLDVTCIGQLRVCLQIALWCVEDNRQDRPSIREIVNTLNNPYIGRALNKPGVGPILLLSVQPQRLCFPLPSTRLISRLLCLTNNKDECIAFRLLTDNPGRYHTELPLCGIVPPKCTYTINVVVHEQTKQLPSNSDEFLTLICTTTHEKELKNLDADSAAVLFGNPDHEVQEMMLPVVCDSSEETISNQIIASQHCRVVPSVDVHSISQNYRQVLSIDVHPKEPWLLTTNQMGTLCIWNYQKKETLNSLEVTPGEPVYSAKFIEPKHWFVTGDGDGYIHVYSYDTMKEAMNFKAHENTIMSLALHSSFSFVLSASDDHLIKLWDWDKRWECMRTFSGHYDRVTQVMFDPRSSNEFLSASMDGSVKRWYLYYGNCDNTFVDKSGGLLCLHYIRDRQVYYDGRLLVAGSSDGVAKVWDELEGECVGTLEGHTNCLTALCWHPKHEVLVTGSLDGTVQIWKQTSTRYRLENIIRLNLGAVTALAYIPEARSQTVPYTKLWHFLKEAFNEFINCCLGSESSKHPSMSFVQRVVVGCEQGIAMVEIDYL
ncbi:uncharacterized protein LOC123442429 isoform X2 [Hordeum vulgare subsp. vulgare]|uniref:uncharacterized protein LOC123442429 isoform X2 n=1 Tax=Hordeum vulgare subsp. vulgare TaxID=112509 RepID=UPI001D1A498C|nr:uncharacterized protein LOC123442429 isoform X2 [Hordeum vulgare subsp. vulgare]